MLKKSDTEKWFTPLYVHSAVHALGTWTIVFYFTSNMHIAWFFGLADLVFHFFIDFLKARPKLGGRFNNPTKPYFWWALGLDQMAHHLINYIFIYILITKL